MQNVATHSTWLGVSGCVFDRNCGVLGSTPEQVAIISGGDSGIGRAVAVHFAREGADVCVMYKDEHQDAQDTQKLVEAEGRRWVPGYCRLAAEL
jgi:NAD(P)-dependent dehydrogenase (short-subunit alcohol dehydrogenase family)